MPTSPTANSGSLELRSPQTYDMHPEPGADPAPGDDPAPPPAAPEPPIAAPTFDGTYSGNATGTGRFRIAPTVTGGVITGILSTPPDAEEQASIPLAGTASAAGAVAMTATDPCGGQVYSLTGSITVDATGGAVMTGTWSQPAAPNCSEARSGTWTATRTTASPTPAPTSLTGRWIGVAPDGVVWHPESDLCESISDLQLDLTQVGTLLTGTITLTTRAPKPAPQPGCSPSAGSLAFTNGTVNGTEMSFSTGHPGATFRGTVAGNRISGVLIGSGDGGQVATFAVTRQ